MAPKKFKQKKYAEKPSEHYIVVLNPWAMPNINRGERDLEAFAAWLRCMFRGLGQPTCVVEAVYTMNTTTDVIVRLSSTVDVVPVLGEHKWSEFLKPSFLSAAPTTRGLQPWDCVLSKTFLDSVTDRNVRARGTSKIFEYNWDRNGEPIKHQWEERYPVLEDPPEAMDFPVRRDYPNPSWTAPPMNIPPRTRCLLLPLPAIRTRTPPPEEVQDEGPHLSPAVKVEVKAEHHVRNQVMDQHGASSRPERQVPTEDTKPFQKQDPYEEESAAQQSLLNVKEEPHEPVVNFVTKKAKEEHKPYHPSPAFLNLIKQKQQVKQEPEQASAHVPSQALRDFLSNYDAACDVEEDHDTRSLPRYSDPRSLKRPSEIEQHGDVFNSSKRIKREG